MRILTVAILAALVAAPAVAQDPNAEPNYGTVRLSGGFLPDPHEVRLEAGGYIDAEDVFEDCSGFITHQPDVRLDWGGGSGPLVLSVDASADTTLVVNGPDGSWYCDDDSGEGLFNPSIELPARAGRYEIWVGTYSSGEPQRATLAISEMGSH